MRETSFIIFLFALVTTLAGLDCVCASIIENSCNCSPLETCDEGKCFPATCFDMEWSPSNSETDVDCGGEICARRCSNSRKCKDGQDCTSGVCSPMRHICLPKECGDLELSGNETAIDCGGPQCDPCGAGKDCERDEDCLSRSCETKNRFLCLSTNCEGKPCGSDPFCPRCPVGFGCEHDAQCESDHCEGGVCYQADCEREGCEEDSECTSKRCSETTKTCLAEYCFDGSGRCGGLCDPCGVGGECSSDDDCTHGLKCDVDNSVCSPSNCFNGILDFDSEADVDCGGDCAAKCNFLESCQSDVDCASNGVCDPDVKKCISSTCVNQVKDGNETDVDCGNSALSGCLPCQCPGSGCTSVSDADISLNLVCDLATSKIVPAHCLDGVLNGDETAMDCGGPSCAKRCGDGLGCYIDTDCESNDCFDGICVPQSCHNRKQDFNETDLDCGGGFCRPCTLSGKCALDTDCQSGMCSEFNSKCQPPECATHCGGPCDPCPDSTPCSSDSDCQSNYCYGELIDSATLARTLKDSIDPSTGSFLFPEAARGVCLPSGCRTECGKGDCPGCPPGSTCDHDSDCASGSCDSTRLICHASTCFDSVKNVQETDIDCGGPLCPRCTRPTQVCSEDSDCWSDHCSKTRLKCVPQTCFNEKRDDLETDVDCGGGECEFCSKKSSTCGRDDDCDPKMSCPNGYCLPKTCFNGIKDFQEVDVDCGLEACDTTCQDNQLCPADQECESGHCFRGRCLPGHCAKECGKEGCANKCEKGEYCEHDRQCENKVSCVANRCVSEEECKLDWKSLGATDRSGCGGLKCLRCGPHRQCLRDSDCDFGLLCDSNRCEFETCFDQLLSSGEVCIDGGAICRRRCPLGDACRVDFDCEPHAACVDSICVQISEEKTKEKFLVEETFTFVDEGVVIDISREMKRDLQSHSTFELPEFDHLALLSAGGRDWKSLLNAASTSLSQIAVSESERVDEKVFKVRQSLPALTVEALCSPSSCVLEGLFQETRLLHPHAFYAARRGVDRAFDVKTVVEGLFLTGNSALSFLRGVDVLALSVVSKARLVLGDAASDFAEGLVVDTQGSLLVRDGARVTGSKLIVFGEIILEGVSVLDVTQTHILGRIKLESGARVRVKGSLTIDGMFDMSPGSVLILDNGTVVDITGTLMVRSGRVEIQGGGMISSSGRIIVPKASSLALTEGVRANVSELIVQGSLVLESKSSLTLHRRTAVSVPTVVTGSIALGPATSMELASSAFVSLVSLREQARLKIKAACLVLDLTSSPTSVLELHDDLHLVHSRSLSVTSVVEVRSQGRFLLGHSQPNSTESRLEFHSPVVFSPSSSLSSLFVVSNRTSLSLVFNSTLIATHPLSIDSNVTVIVKSLAWFTNTVDHGGHLLVEPRARLLLSHMYSGHGTVINDGSIIVTGDALVSSRNFSGKGTLLIGTPEEAELAHLSKELFGFLPGQIFDNANCTSKHTLIMSLVSSTSFVLDLCLPNPLKADLVSTLGLDGDVLLTKSYGAPLDPSAPLPNVIWMNPTPVQFSSALNCASRCSNRRIAVSHTDGGTFEISNNARMDFNGLVTVTKSGYLATSKRARTRLLGGLDAHGEVWLGPDTFTEMRSIVHSRGNFTCNPTANITLCKCSATFSGRISQSGYISVECSSNLTVEGFLLNEGHIFGDSMTSISFLPPFGPATHRLYPFSTFFFTKNSILDTRGYLYFGPQTKSVFEKGSLLESSGDMVLEREGSLQIETAYTYFEGPTDVLGSLSLKGSLTKAKFTGSYARVSGSASVESGALLEFAGKSTMLTSIITSKDKGKVVFSAHQADVTCGSGCNLVASVDMIGIGSKIAFKKNSALVCLSFCEVRRVNLTLGNGSRMEIRNATMEMNANLLAEQNSSILINGKNATLHVIAGDFTVYGTLSSVDGGQLILDSPRILGRRDLLLDRTVVKTPLLTTETCSGAALSVQPGASLRLESSKRIICSGPSPIRVETGGTLVIASSVDMSRGLVLERTAFLVIEPSSELLLRSSSELSLLGAVMIHSSARMVLGSPQTVIGGKVEMFVGSKLTMESGETRMIESGEITTTQNKVMVEISHRAMLLVDRGASLTLNSPDSSIDVLGKVKNNGRIMISEHGSKLTLGGHYLGMGDVFIGTFAKASIKGMFASSHPASIECSGALLTFVQASDATIRARSLILRNASRIVVEERSKLAIRSDVVETGPKSKFIISGGNVSVEQTSTGPTGEFTPVQSNLVGVLEIAGSWISSHSSWLDVRNSIRIKRGGKMELEGKITMGASSLSDFIRIESGASLKLISGSLHVYPDVFMDVSGELLALGALHIHSSRFINNGGLISVEGKLIMHGGEGAFKSGELSVLQAGAVHFKSSKCDAMPASVASGENVGGFHFGAQHLFKSQGLIQVFECASVTCASSLASSGDVILDKHSKLTLLASASFDSSLPSSIHLEGELIVEKGSNLKWSAIGTGSSFARVTVFGSLQFAPLQGPVELAFEADHSKASITIHEAGTISGSVHLRNCSMIIDGGRAEPGDLERTGVFVIEHGDFDLMNGGLLETDVRLSPMTGEVTHDLVDVKGGSARVRTGSTLAFAVLDVDKFDFPVIQCDLRGLIWTKESLRIAAYSVDFAKHLEELSYHAYESETESTSSLRVRVESVTGSSSQSVLSRVVSSMLAWSTSHDDPGGINRVIIKGLNTLSDWKPLLEKYIGGEVSIDPENDQVALITCAEPFECRSFCTVLKGVQNPLSRALGVEMVSEFPLGLCDRNDFWPAVLVPCVTDGIVGSAEKGEMCSFPFEFEGVSYSSCAHDDVLGDWCLTDQGHWGACLCGPFNISSLPLEKLTSKCATNGLGFASKGEACAVPFFEDRSSFAEPHFTCVGTGLGGYGFCRTQKGELAGCDAKCLLDEHEHDLLERSRVLDCVTNGRGHAPAGKQCRFPFDWGGRKRFGCVGSGWGGNEGFCLTATGLRGGCACSGSTEVHHELTGESSSQPFFVFGPLAHVLTEDSVQIRAKTVGGTRDSPHFYVLAVKSGSSAPRSPSTSLKDFAHGPSTTADDGVDVLVVKRLDWRVEYDLYVFFKGMDDEDFSANALVGIRLKPPSKLSFRLVVMPQFLSLREGGPAQNLSITRVDKDDGLLEVQVRASEPNQVTFSDQIFFLKSTKTIEVAATRDDILEGDSHALVLHVIDMDESSKVDVSLVVSDERAQTIPKLESSSALVEFILPEEENSERSPMDEEGVVPARRRLILQDDHEQAYRVKLRSPPSSAVIIELVSTDDVAIQPRKLVFGRHDWNRPRKVTVWSSSKGKAGMIQHRVRSKDSRFNQAESIELGVMINRRKLSSSKPARSLDTAASSTSTITTTPNASSLLGTVFPTIPVFLFPQTTVHLTYSTTLSKPKNVQAVLTTMSGATNSKPDGDPSQSLPDGLFVAPSTFSLNNTTPTIVRVWAETDPGMSFSFLVVVSPLPSSGVDGQSEAIVSQVNYVSRAPAIVVSRTTVSLQNGQYSISLSIQPANVVTVAISTLADSVCLDLEANWARPCSSNCRRCLTNVPVVQLSPRIVKYGPSTFGVTVSVLGWSDNHLLEPYPVQGSLALLVTQTVLVDSSSAAGPYVANTPTVFGPTDSVIQGVQVDISSFTGAVTPTKVAMVNPVSNQPGTFLCALLFIPRADVHFNAISNCQPSAFVLSDISQDVNMTCDGQEGDNLWVRTSSDDPAFDSLQINFVLPAIPGKPESSIVVPAVVGVTTGLATLVALLVVYVYMGPRASGWAARRPMKRGMGKRPARSTPEEPQLQPEVREEEENPPNRSISAAVPSELASALFALPPPEVFHISDVVVVKYEGFFDDVEVQYFKGRVIEEGDVYKVLFIDGDVDDAVDPDTMRRFQDVSMRPMGGMVDEEYSVRLERSSPDQSFGLKIGWTTNDRVVITGFTPGSIAFSCLMIQLGDEIVEMNGSRVPDTFDQVTSAIKNSGTVLMLKMRSFSSTSSPRASEPLIGRTERDVREEAIQIT